MDIDKLSASIREKYALYRNADLQILQADEVFKAKVKLTAETQNHVKMMHAAYLFAVGEFLGGLVPMRYLAKPDKFQPVVRDLKIDHRPCSTPQTRKSAMFDTCKP